MVIKDRKNIFHILLGTILLFISCCKPAKNDLGNLGRDCMDWVMVGYQVNHINLSDFTGQTDTEKDVVIKVRKYLADKSVDIDSFYVSYVSYPDTTLSCNLAYEEDYYVVIDLVHQKTLNYIDSLENMNTMLVGEYKNEEFVPIIVPPTGNISGKDRGVFYYFKRDSIGDILSQ